MHFTEEPQEAILYMDAVNFILIPLYWPQRVKGGHWYIIWTLKFNFLALSVMTRVWRTFFTWKVGGSTPLNFVSKWPVSHSRHFICRQTCIDTLTDFSFFIYKLWQSAKSPICIVQNCTFVCRVQKWIPTLAYVLPKYPPHVFCNEFEKILLELAKSHSLINLFSCSRILCCWWLPLTFWLVLCVLFGSVTSS